MPRAGLDEPQFCKKKHHRRAFEILALGRKDRRLLLKSLIDLVKENQRERLREQMHEESFAAASCVAVVAVEPLAFFEALVHVVGAFKKVALANVAVLFPKPINSVRDKH